MPEAPKNSDYTLIEKNKKSFEFIEIVTTNADEVQKKVLGEILSRNAHVEYLQRHGLNGHTDRDTFKKLMPVISYDDIRNDINRIANGDTSPILCSKPISELLTSSGTSGGERKLMPTVEEELERRSLLYSLLMPVMSQFVPDLDKGKGMYFLFIKSEAKTPGGLVASPVLTSYYKSIHFKNRLYDSNTNYTSPNETILCPDSYQSMYSQLLCGLCQNKDVLRVGAVFDSGFIRAIRYLEKHWPLLAYDIRTGTIDPLITDPSVREAVMKILKPDPKLADFIENECSKVSWQGIITRLWPNTKYVDVIVTGTMAQYIPTLDYYSNGLPLVCTMYASSECYFGLNINTLCKPSEVSYTLIPTMAYFEFLPVHRNNGVTNTISMPKSLNEKEQQDLVDLADVKLGHKYELVVTTYAVESWSHYAVENQSTVGAVDTCSIGSDSSVSEIEVYTVSIRMDFVGEFSNKDFKAASTGFYSKSEPPVFTKIKYIECSKYGRAKNIAPSRIRRLRRRRNKKDKDDEDDGEDNRQPPDSNSLSLILLIVLILMLFLIVLALIIWLMS